MLVQIESQNSRIYISGYNVDASIPIYLMHCVQIESRVKREKMGQKRKIGFDKKKKNG